MPAIAVGSVLVSVEEFLAAEPGYEVKHEYLAGMPYAMAGASGRHDTIATNLIGLLHGQLRGKPCQVHSSDFKVKLKISESTYFYYPDAMIVCGRAGLGKSWAEQPRVLFEILSESTRAIDEREKRIAYLSISSLDVYVLIEQDTQKVIVERRTREGWTREILEGPNAKLSLPTVGVELPIGELYERLPETE